MDFDSKISLFKKKALWKQLEGYKATISLKEEELHNCEKQKTEAERVSQATNLILSKVKTSFENNSNSESVVHESLKPVQEFIQNSQLGEEFCHNFEVILSILSRSISDKHEKFPTRAIESASELQKDLKISEMTTKLNDQAEKYGFLESKIFFLEKQVFALKSFKTAENNTSESPSKKPRIDQDGGNDNDADEGNKDLLAKLNVVSAELVELNKISKNRLNELESFQIENRKLHQELESKNDQLRKIPQEFLKDGASFRQMNEDLRRYKHDLNDAIATIKGLEKEIDESNYRNKKIISQLERDVKEKYNKLDDFVRTTDTDLSRLRKDRDSMRQMYEQSNTLLSACQKQMSSYQKNLNCSEVAVNQLNRTISTLKSHLASFTNLGGDQAELSKIIETLRADEQLYIEELENLGKAFERLQIENAELIKKVADRDDQLSKLLGEKLKAEFSFIQIQKESESSLERAHKIEEIAKHRVAEIELREDTLRRQVSSMDKGLSDQMIAINNYKSRLNEASADNSHLRSKIEKYAAEIAELQNLVPSNGHKDQLAFEKRRLGEELSIANKKLEAYSASGVGLVKELEEELGNYKKIMKCNSCHIRDKNAVILKCMHCFCKTCLDIRLETRQRKCPNCGDPFGAGDVKQIFL